MHSSESDLLCPCGTQFLSHSNFLAHQAKGKFSCRASRTVDDLAVLLQTQLPSGPASSPRDLDAFDGDLLHKAELRAYGLSPSDPLFLSLIENKNQGRYLQKYYPDSVPPGSPSDHTLGSIFESLYFTGIVFRSTYILRVDRGYC